MPIYEYQCRACEHRLEVIQKVSDAPLTECPACGKAELKKLVSAAGFRLKGGGWYETDFKNKGRKNVAADKSDGQAAKSGDAPKSGDASKSTDSGSDSAAGTKTADTAGSAAAAAD